MSMSMLSSTIPFFNNNGNPFLPKSNQSSLLIESINTSFSQRSAIHSASLFNCEDVIYQSIQPIYFLQNKNGFECSYEEYEIFLHAYSYEDMIDKIAFKIHMSWEIYVQCDASTLDGGAMQLRLKYLQDFVQM